MKKPDGVGIVGMGIALPETVRTNDWWSEQFRSEQMKGDLVTTPEQAGGDVDPEIAHHAGKFRSDPFRGARERRVLEDDRETSDLEALAVTRALQRAAVPRENVDLLMDYSMPTDYAAPLNHALVAEKAGLRRDLVALTLNTGCASFLTQLHVASSLLQSGQYRTAVVVQSVVMSRLLDYSTPMSVCAGDGAVAAVVQFVAEDEGVVTYVQDTDGKLHGGMRLQPTGDPTARWYRGDRHQMALTAGLGSRESARTIGTKLVSFCRETCSTALATARCRPEDVDFFVTSQPSPWFGRACCDGLGIPEERTLDTFAEYGHLMGASAPMNLWTAYQRGFLRKGSLVMVYAPGAGFIRGALLLRWSLDPTGEEDP